MSQGVVADLGPQSRVIVMPGLDKRRPAALYAISGWLKLSSTPGKDAPTVVLSTEFLELMNIPGSVVLHLNGKNAEVFAESGTATVAERRRDPTTEPIVLKAGSFFARTGNEKALVTPRPPASFIQGVPRSFLDPAPLLAPVFSARPEPALKALGDLTYAQATPWLGAESAVGVFLVTQWKTGLNKDLRSGLADNIKRHPEWRRVLFPEKNRFAPAASSPKVW